MKVIFLDIDGVLNCQNSKSSCFGMMGIDNKKVEVLKSIVDKSGAKIVLISSWRTGWNRVHKEEQGYMANYLDKKLKSAGLYIIDKIDDYTAMLGEGILKWLENKEVESFVILDDEVWDYEKCNLSDKFVKTEFYDDNGGLNAGEAREAMKILCQDQSLLLRNTEK